MKGACSAASALNAVSKYQMKWFLWNAKRNGGCAIGILDWGHHGVVQFKSRWKARAASPTPTSPGTWWSVHQPRPDDLRGQLQRREVRRPLLSVEALSHAHRFVVPTSGPMTIGLATIVGGTPSAATCGERCAEVDMGIRAF